MLFLDCCGTEVELEDLEDLERGDLPEVEYTGRCPECGAEGWVEDAGWGEEETILTAWF